MGRGVGVGVETSMGAERAAQVDLYQDRQSCIRWGGAQPHRQGSGQGPLGQFKGGCWELAKAETRWSVLPNTATWGMCDENPDLTDPGPTQATSTRPFQQRPVLEPDSPRGALGCYWIYQGKCA